MVSEEDLKNMSPEEIRKLQEENCIFCKIAKKEIPSKIIYEDDLVCAFLDIQPKTMGHTVIIPKKHLVFFSQFPEEETKHIFKVVKNISQCMIKALQVGGTNIYMANGEGAGQFAPHAMIHVIPRKKEDEIPELHPIKEEYPDEVLAQVQKALVSRIEEVMGIELKGKLIPDAKDKKEEIDEKKETQSKQTSKIDDNEIDLDKISNLFK